MIDALFFKLVRVLVMLSRMYVWVWKAGDLGC
jgi:hypothetical protein